MAGATSVDISVKFPDWKAIARKARASIPPFIAAMMQTQRALIFESEGRENGRPGWLPLKFRVGQILKKSGTLSKSIGPRNNGVTPGHATGSIVRIGNNVVTIGTKIAYASVQNDGATIKAKGNKPMHFKGQRMVQTKRGNDRMQRFDVFCREVTIPARTFNDFTSQDIDELTESCENFIASMLGGS